MDVEAAIVARLTATGSPVAALIGGRIAPSGVHSGLARPNVVYQRVGRRGVNSNDGPTGLARVTLQVSSYADDYGQAKALARAIKSLLDGFSGAIGGGGGGGVLIRSAFLDDERDAPQPPSPGQIRGIPGVVQVYEIAFDE